jgi:hypothetical protein
MIPFADNFLAGSVLTLVMPGGLLIAIAVWYMIAVRRVPQDTPESSSVLPPREVVETAGDTASEVTPGDPQPPQA